MDVGEPVTFAIALIDGLLRVFIAASCFGLLAVWLMPTPLAARAAVFVAATGLATSFTVLAQREPGPVDLGIAIWAVAAAMLDAAVGVFLLSHSRLPNTPARQGVALAGLLALALPLAQFWHQTTWSSATEKVSLGLTPTIEVQGGDDDDLLVNVKVDLVNGGSGRVRIISAAVDVCHWGSTAVDITYVPDEMRDLNQCTRWTAFKQMSWLDADISLKGSKVFRVPRTRPHLVVVARIAYARGDRLQIVSEPFKEMDTAPDDEALDGTCEHADFYRIEDDSRGRDLAQADKYLGYADRQGHGRWTYFIISGDPVECRDSERDLREFYGVTELSIIAEKWVVDTDPSPVPDP